jgi:hypothetical protein
MMPLSCSTPVPSSIKFSLFLERKEALDPDVRGQIEGLYTKAHFVSKKPDGTVKAEQSWPDGFRLGHDGALDHLVDHLRSELADDRLIGIGHRVVHGGLADTQPVRVDGEVLKVLETFVPLALLHQPHNLAPIRRALERAPELPQVACFDTSSHRTQPEVAQMFALPDELRKAGVMRYGFHGLSYEHIRRNRRDRGYGRHRRKRSGNPQPGLPRCRLAGGGAQCGGQRRRPCSHQHWLRPRCRLGHPNQRGIDDCASYTKVVGHMIQIRSTKPEIRNKFKIPLLPPPKGGNGRKRADRLR